MPVERAKYISLKPRLQAALSLVGRANIVADIGCDHGRLSAALLQQGAAKYVIAADCSADSLAKAKDLFHKTGLAEKASLRQGDGLSVLAPHEADCIVVCGMGGRLIADILAAAALPLMGANRAVFQPMRGVAELRAYLAGAGYSILEERIVADAGRYYQVFSAAPGHGEQSPPGGLQQGGLPQGKLPPDEPPPGWPRDCFLMGHGALHDPNFRPHVEVMLRQCEKRLQTATGTRGEALLRKKHTQLLQLLKLAGTDP